MRYFLVLSGVRKPNLVQMINFVGLHGMDGSKGQMSMFYFFKWVEISKKSRNEHRNERDSLGVEME